MIVGAVRESHPGERRVALVPGVLRLLTQAGLEALLEPGAGEAAGFSDDAYREAGARFAGSRDEVFSSAQILAQVRSLGANPGGWRVDLGKMRRGQILVALADPLSEPHPAREAAEHGVTVFAMELIPRIARAQSMDALSSMATVAGYKAVLMAADRLPRMFPLMMTAAGTVTPARIFVVGAGVAGLQAIATSRRLGAVVEAYDVRPAVKDQVQSLGAKFVEMGLETSSAEDAGGYARPQDEDFYRRQREMMAQVLAHSDVVITTAAIPGQKAPILVTREMVAGMAPGSIIVDLAAERGGNCELTRPDEEVVEAGVTILGPTNITSTLPYHASQLYAKNVTNFLRHLVKKGELTIDLNDEITRETLLVRDGEVTPPRIRQALGLAEAQPARREA